jgi:hypothetical protein
MISAGVARCSVLIEDRLRILGGRAIGNYGEVEMERVDDLVLLLISDLTPVIKTLVRFILFLFHLLFLLGQQF